VCHQPIGYEYFQIIALQISGGNVLRYDVKPSKKRLMCRYVGVNFREMNTAHQALFVGKVIARVVTKTFCVLQLLLVGFRRKQHRSQSKKLVMLRINVGVTDSIDVLPFESHMPVLTQFIQWV
jgi:hypothetical protein